MEERKTEEAGGQAALKPAGEEKYFIVIAFVLFSILFMCLIYSGILLKMIPAREGAFGILIAGVVPHLIGVILSIIHKDTVAANIIYIFFAFWTEVALGILFFNSVGMQALFKFVEPGMAVVIFTHSFFYLKKLWSFMTLWLLGFTVTFLWILKLLPAEVVSASRYDLAEVSLILLLAVFVIITGIDSLLKGRIPEKAQEGEEPS